MTHAALTLSLALTLASPTPAPTPEPPAAAATPEPQAPASTAAPAAAPTPTTSPTPATPSAAEPAGARTTAGPVAITKVMSPEKALLFEVTIPAPIADVWTALSTAEGLATWLWRDARVDLRPGGDWLVIAPDGKTGGGTIVSFEPQKRLELRALAPERFPTVRSVGTTAVFELEALNEGSTRVTLAQTGWREGTEWDQAYDYLAAGNAQLLIRLHQRFVSGPRDFSQARP